MARLLEFDYRKYESAHRRARAHPTRQRQSKRNSQSGPHRAHCPPDVPMPNEPMRLSSKSQAPSSREIPKGSTFIIVLWIAFGLVSLTVYFASSMSFELHASDNRVCGLAAEEAIEGAARYVGYLLSNLQTNGAAPDPTTYQCQAVPVSD